MLKIGLVGEAPNDTKAIANLLKQKFTNCEFVTLIENVRGANLDCQKNKHRLRKEFENKKPHFVVFIRDLDALEKDYIALEKRKEYFTESKSVVDEKAIFLLNIYEIEALILSDVENFNKFYEINIEFSGNPMLVVQPKEFLMQKSKYRESDCPQLFETLNIEKITKNCKYFQEFYINFKNFILRIYK